MGPTETTKRCTRCGREFPLDSFPLHGKGKRGQVQRGSKCRPCKNEYHREYQARRPPAMRSADARRRDLMRKYGITVEQYDEMLAAQGGVCAICGGTDPERRLAVDHSHETGAVRGLLCRKCNVALERAEKHGHGWLTRAAEYLQVQGAHLL